MQRFACSGFFPATKVAGTRNSHQPEIRCISSEAPVWRCLDDFSFLLPKVFVQERVNRITSGRTAADREQKMRIFSTTSIAANLILCVDNVSKGVE